MTIKVALVVYVLVTLACVLFQLSRDREIELLPSLGWLLLMVVPFLVQYEYFPEPYRRVQTIGVIVVGAFILLGDMLTSTQKFRECDAEHLPALLMDGRTYAVIFALLAAYHLSILDKIPFLERITMDTPDEAALQWMREKTSKLLDVPDFMKYVFTWAVNIFSPLSIALLAFQKRYGWLLVTSAMALIYALMSLAKVPVFLLVITLMVVFLRTITLHTRYRMYGFSVALMLIVAWHATEFLSTHPYSVMNYQVSDKEIGQLQLSPKDPRTSFTRGDHLRMLPKNTPIEFSAVQKVYNYYVYRLFLGPADVSSRWYQYFPDVSGELAGFAALTPATRRDAAQHPARRVGKWAYVDRFPERYLETAQAYASVDADAYGRWGVPGVFGAGILILILRFASKSLLVDVPVTQVLYASALVLMALLWPMASMQAVLVANGLAPILFAMAVIALVLCRKRGRKG